MPLKKWGYRSKTQKLLRKFYLFQGLSISESIFSLEK
jgi:hypothetical protein